MASATDLEGGSAISSGVVFDQPGTGVTAFATSATDLSMASGGIVYLLDSGTTTGTVALSGGFGGSVYSGGSAVSTSVAAGGIETLSSGGVALDAIIGSGATQIVFCSAVSPATPM